MESSSAMATMVMIVVVVGGCSDDSTADGTDGRAGHRTAAAAFSCDGASTGTIQGAIPDAAPRAPRCGTHRQGALRSSYVPLPAAPPSRLRLPIPPTHPHTILPHNIAPPSHIGRRATW